MKKKTLWTIILFISATIMIISFLYILMLYNSDGNSREDLLPETTTISSTTANTADTTTVALPDNPIDFSLLKDTNPDIYAWITIPDTNIDYPVLQAGEDHDDFFYLSHNAKGDYEFAGSIYSEKQNAKDFSDPVTVLYGHNMLNDTMFADLHKFSNEDFFNEHEFITVYTPGHILTYRVYAAYEYDDRHILNSFDFSDEKVIDEYFQFTLNPTTMNRIIRPNVSLTVNDKILTLSTCTNNSSTRYLLQGVLHKDEPTK